MLQATLLAVLALVDERLVEFQDLYPNMDACLTVAETIIEANHVVALDCSYVQIDEKVYAINFGNAV